MRARQVAVVDLDEQLRPADRDPESKRGMPRTGEVALDEHVAFREQDVTPVEDTDASNRVVAAEPAAQVEVIQQHAEARIGRKQDVQRSRELIAEQHIDQVAIAILPE